jgi:hypothetical protein
MSKARKFTLSTVQTGSSLPTVARTLAVTASLALSLAGCSKAPANFSTLATSQSFQQSQAQVNNKIDVMWVVDNSNSMDPLQTSLIANFNSFINNFQTLGFDYNMVVTTTDSYLANTKFDKNPQLAAWRDGANGTFSGDFFITPKITNIVQSFVTNATQGAYGSGDERAFQSMIESLNSPLNAGFPRPGSFMAVIILSDEDDFMDYTRPEVSWTTGGIADHDYTNPNLPSVDSLVSQLDSITGSTATNRKYNVSSIAVLDSACQQTHVTASPVTIVGQRYMDMANQTNGILGSICDSSYSNSLNFIQQQIVTLASQFPISGNPDPTTLVITVNGTVVPQDATNGWTYVAASNMIQFHGTAVPASGANISVGFNPLTLQ